MYIFAKFSNEYTEESNTIDEHKKILDKHGSFIWGQYSEHNRDGIRKEMREAIYEVIDSGNEAYVIFNKSSYREIYIGQLINIYGKSEIEKIIKTDKIELIPNYYRENLENITVFFEIKKIQKFNYDYFIKDIVKNNIPINLNASRNTSLFYVDIVGNLKKMLEGDIWDFKGVLEHEKTYVVNKQKKDVVDLEIEFDEFKENIYFDFEESDEIFLEGELKNFTGKRYSRNNRNRNKAIEIHGYNCAVCDFNFEEFYGEVGKNFIEIHHIVPLSTLKEKVEINPEKDLVPLCANCHRIVHRNVKEPLSIEELKDLIYQKRKI